MQSARANRLIEHMHVAMPASGNVEATDAQLLECYLASRDAGSFAAIVQRHGPMVWGVCRRLLTAHQDAEDAFQATFLVLVRKAATVLPRQMVGNWLHGVARQTALKARAVAQRRSMREFPMADPPEHEKNDVESPAELQPIIDEELARLPQRYRAVLLLCDLEGKTRKEAASQLSVPIGTVAGWLARARPMLARRLVRRGVSLSAVSVAGTLVRDEASARVPANVVSSTIDSALSYTAGSTATGTVRASVSLLTEGVLRSMFLSKLKATLAIVFAAGLLCTGITGLAINATAGQEPKSKPVPEGKVGRLVAEPTAPPPDLRQLKQEVDRLRTELDALKKQVTDASKPAAPPSVEDGEPKLAIRVYPVAQLITNEKTTEETLVRVLTNTVKPNSWSMLGGSGTIEYFAAGKSLVVNQTEEVHVLMEKLLGELLKVKELQDAERPAKK